MATIRKRSLHLKKNAFSLRREEHFLVIDPVKYETLLAQRTHAGHQRNVRFRVYRRRQMEVET